jgi:hypothetical protein
VNAPLNPQPACAGGVRSNRRKFVDTKVPLRKPHVKCDSRRRAVLRARRVCSSERCSGPRARTLVVRRESPPPRGGAAAPRERSEGVCGTQTSGTSLSGWAPARSQRARARGRSSTSSKPPGGSSPGRRAVHTVFSAFPWDVGRRLGWRERRCCAAAEGDREREPRHPMATARCIKATREKD